MDEIRAEKGTIPDAIDGQLVELSPADARARELFPELFTSVRELKREYPDPAAFGAIDFYREIKENYRSGFGTDTLLHTLRFKQTFGVYWPAEAYRILSLELIQENLDTLINEQENLINGIVDHIHGTPPENIAATVVDPDEDNLAWILSQNRYNLADFYRRRGDLESALDQIDHSLWRIRNTQMVLARLIIKAWLLTCLDRREEGIDQIAIARSIDATLTNELGVRFGPEYDGMDALLRQPAPPPVRKG